ncbi:hypothetical protein B0A79_21940 [Flavobacterium piscis]|uniref:DUF3108 domain-containing protein n=1 Tax=Flavobacterium piscis TaxID=1114874 RepID=A0ABX2XR32_9FLAO|nr:DUF6134 family protein [Flavobacterium piscis]OCB78346.1 hypothetical protein FLP_01200 [Flavobacterium piscis]OXE97165.1 hypothetical protein B0A79_21940 [Flavobacterium piscis]
MIPIITVALLFWFLQKITAIESGKFSFLIISEQTKLTVLFFLFTINSQAQEKTVNYNVLRNGTVIGQMQFSQKTNNDDVFLKISSEVKTRLIFGIDIKTEEGSHFKNGKLISSYVKRHVNGKEKANKTTQLIDSGYKTLAENKKGQIKQNYIDYNLMLLYSKEPVGENQVYSDSFQQFLVIKKTNTHSYRIVLPDGNYNDYHFLNGVCQKVELHHSLFTINIQIA